MFTGIIQNCGILKKRSVQAGQAQLSFRMTQKEKRPLVSGESIAVNGVCLTVRKPSEQSFEADVIRETLEATTLGRLAAGDRVNLERSLRLGDSLGGHFVTGHVDGIGKILNIERSGRNRTFHLMAPPALLPFIAPKGSVVVEGVSLTVQKVRGNIFEVGLVPHTLRQTTLSFKKAGNAVNLEADLIARYLKLFSVLPPLLGAREKADKALRRQLSKQGF